MAIKYHAPIEFAPDQHGVLVFHSRRKNIPEGIEVLPAQAPQPTPAADPSIMRQTIQSVRFGWGTFLALCSTGEVKVFEGGYGHCLVYINYTAKKEKAEPDDCWVDGNAYKLFLRSLFNETFKKVKVKWEDRKITVRFSPERATKPVETMLVFTHPQPEESVVAAS
ncbi:MAG: hypothetical protein A3D65_02135 [Candidatus Lloydbacteria bacterium RIFCSPHIGHO2_02_FULL_50_13]|uniref:Uncharacterized protein n=1 Tax=Candidatus Lloydbacteria bacterium RIFCSPHIGHO2_02_FULL_50_13 TaxID=1798661 RepID=A0A1G2CZK5_9BACT|nr:MAG: hypothetical protein A3D65_02135 [Candidatus Lloydbacteria bacterium RIFCSPHIGHO2_02_FULL_50_13]